MSTWLNRGFSLAAALFLLPGIVSAQISDGVVKIGVLTDLTGPASDATGAGSMLAAQMAVAVRQIRSRKSEISGQRTEILITDC